VPPGLVGRFQSFRLPAAAIFRVGYNPIGGDGMFPQDMGVLPGCSLSRVPLC
jgi:hypothetical protein